MWPNLFVIGAAKAGTTSLHYYLDQHPQIHMSPDKEPAYFMHLAAPDAAPTYSVRDRAAYLRLFESPLPVRGEASVSYSFWPYPRGVPQLIRDAAPDARFIYLVRDPVERILSHYRHRIVLGEEHRDLRQVMETPDEPRERYIAASSYATQLEQYLTCFPADRFLVLDHADLLTRRDDLMRRCFEFLGVDPTFTSSRWDRIANETSTQRRYSPLADRLRHSGAYRRTIGWFTPETRDKALWPARRLLTKRVETKVSFDADVRAHYATLLAPEADRLRRLTGESFATWQV